MRFWIPFQNGKTILEIWLKQNIQKAGIKYSSGIFLN